MLKDDRSYLLGDQPGWVDILAYFPLWMCRGNLSNAEQLLQGLSALQAWEQRVKSGGHGRWSPLSNEDALAQARNSSPVAVQEVANDAWPRLAANASVSVTPQDYGAVPVAGSLVRLTHSEIAIRREDPLVGEVVVHFPRQGYIVEAA
jgi:hypothetical protein